MLIFVSTTTWAGLQYACILYPLDKARQEIRLLTINPEKDRTRTISCSLHTVSLQDFPYFEALSYVWGDPTEQRSILVDAEQIPVTQNLATAMSHLRYTDKPRTIWIDAICIDQDNLDEKNIQVPLMGTVYSTAIRVISWLGESNFNIEVALGLINTFEKSTQTQKSAGGRMWATVAEKSGVCIKYQRMEEIAFLTAHVGLLEILSRPYWTRMWTYQEWYLPGTQSVCMCGDSTFNPLYFAMDLKFRFSKLTASIMGSYENFEVTFLNDDELQKHVRALRRLIQTSKVLYDQLREFPILEPEARQSLKVTNPMTRLLFHTQSRKYSHPLDRVYGLHGMNSLIGEIYPPDYRKPISQVMIETTAFMINHDQQSQIFQIFQFCNQHDSEYATVPSWTLDLFALYGKDGWDEMERKVPDMQIAVRPERSLYEDTGFPPPLVTDDLLTIRLSARRVGMCHPLYTFSGNLDANVNMIDDLSRILPENMADAGLWDPTSFNTRLWQTCMGANEDPNHAISKNELYEEIRSQQDYSVETIQSFINDIKSRKDFSRTRKTVQSVNTMAFRLKRLDGKVLFLVTAEGVRLEGEEDRTSLLVGLGIGDGHIEKGDIAVVASGVGQTLVLRHKPELDEKDRSYHTISGKAAVDGINEFEKSLQTPFVQKVKEQPFEEFWIR
ncbi:Heterokaryon incompatibility [Penicillium herquei]|nr:Heterokaryon incompatibility [Penicillium herquei]